MVPDPRPAEVQVDEALLLRLLEEQHPDLARGAVRRVAEGWDCVIFRLDGLGEPLVARLPRRAVAAAGMAEEIRWLPRVAPGLPLAVPVPLRAGGPGRGFPFPWSVARWIEGETADRAPPADLREAARGLGTFVRALHRPAPEDAPQSPFRGVPLIERDASFRERLERVSTRLDASAARALWEELAALPGWAGPPVWCHGDLHPGNLLVQGGALAGVIDWGDLHGGDPAPDLASAWLLLPRALHAAFRDALGGVDEPTWQRGRGWALFLVITFLDAAQGDPRHSALPEAVLARVLEG